jgi:hypothetical protein
MYDGGHVLVGDDADGTQQQVASSILVSTDQGQRNSNSDVVPTEPMISRFLKIDPHLQCWTIEPANHRPSGTGFIFQLTHPDTILARGESGHINVRRRPGTRTG